MTRLLAALVPTVLAAVFPGGALAGWSAPFSVPVRDASATAVTVNANGDVAVAWAGGGKRRKRAARAADE